LILSVGLNTSIDKAYIVESFDIGSITRVKDVILTPGGKGLNVAKVLVSLGQSTLATGFVGGSSGMFLVQTLEEKRIPFEFIHIAGETRTCINIIDRANNIQTELLEPGPMVSYEKMREFIELYIDLVNKSDIVTLSGSVPLGVDKTIYKKLIDIAKGSDKKVILDTSGELLEEGIKSSPTLIKPNKFEAEQLLGRELHTIDDIIKAAFELLKTGPEIVAISLGSRGVVIAERFSKVVYRAIPPKITPLNTVGCGDAMIAAFASGLHDNLSLDNLTKYAVAVSTAAALSPLTGEIEVDKIDSILEKVALETLN